MTFLLEEDRSPDSPLTSTIYRVISATSGSFISKANTHWEMVVTRYQGETVVVMRGPETQASQADFPAEFDATGIVFAMGAYMPLLRPGGALDRRDIVLPMASGRRFWLHGSAWEVPTYDNADVFVARLIRQGLLVRDDVVSDALRGIPQAYSPRALQYRFSRVTGLTLKLIRQIERANRAAALLEGGLSILDTVQETDYFDQAHLTNSLKRFLGTTPMQMLRLRDAV
jgi:hypothetical protein